MVADLQENCYYQPNYAATKVGKHYATASDPIKAFLIDQ
jgi:hypothetical protein